METNRCPSCGFSLMPNAMICPKCGIIIDSNSTNDNTMVENVMPSRQGGKEIDGKNSQIEQGKHNTDKNGNISKTLLLSVIAILLVLIGGMVYFMMSRESKYDDIIHKNDSIVNENNSYRQKMDKIAREESDKKKMMKYKLQRKRTAYNALNEFLVNASALHAYTDDLGFSAYRMGRVYYVHDINRDSIPEIIVMYEKMYEGGLIENEALLDCYRYNFTKGVVECLYNRLNKANPAFKGTILYTFGAGTFDKIIYNKYEGKYSISRDCTNDYPVGLTSLAANDIQNVEPLRTAFGFE